MHKTFDGIQKWYHHEFTHLGWMVMAKAEGRTDKVASYKYSVYRMLTDIDELMSAYQDPDKLRDLRVLRDNTQVLYEFISAHL
jgi:hypothetical protein